MSWTQERVELLRKLWVEGLSASQVAAELGGGITRMAVIGKVHRLGIADRSVVKTTKPARNADAFYAQQKKKRTPLGRQLPKKPEPAFGPQPGDEVDIDYNDGAFVCEAAGVDIAGLKPHHCRWPLGDPRSESFKYCGAPRVGTGLMDVYCAAHRALAYRPATKFEKSANKRARAL